MRSRTTDSLREISLIRIIVRAAKRNGRATTPAHRRAVESPEIASAAQTLRGRDHDPSRIREAVSRAVRHGRAATVPSRGDQAEVRRPQARLGSRQCSAPRGGAAHRSLA
jgi:hypothetical protein